MTMLTADELVDMQVVQGLAMPDTCTHYRSSQTVNTIGEAAISWSTLATGVECRLAKSGTQQSKQTPMAQQQTVIGAWVLTVAKTVDIRSGDRVVVAGQTASTYEVIDVAAGPAWETARRAELREVERG